MTRSTLPPRRATDDLWDHIRQRCVQEGDCLVWQGAKSTGGYGIIGIRGAHRPVHRVVYEYFHGAVPPGLDLDHVHARGCRSRACCNVDHLEPVTRRVNLLRGKTITARNAAKTHCPRGHEYTEENLDRWAQQHGDRVCMICVRLRARLRQADRRQTRQCFRCTAQMDPYSQRLCTSHLLQERVHQNAYLRKKALRDRSV